MGEALESRLGLAGYRLRFEDNQLHLKWKLRGLLLRGVGNAVDIEERCKVGQFLQGVSLFFQIQTNIRGCRSGAFSRCINVIGLGPLTECEVSFGGSEPICQHVKAKEHMLKGEADGRAASPDEQAAGNQSRTSRTMRLTHWRGVEVVEGSPTGGIGRASMHKLRLLFMLAYSETVDMQSPSDRSAQILDTLSGKLSICIYVHKNYNIIIDIEEEFE